jgi:hypothetical protein
LWPVVGTSYATDGCGLTFKLLSASHTSITDPTGNGQVGDPRKWAERDPDEGWDPFLFWADRNEGESTPPSPPSPALPSVGSLSAATPAVRVLRHRQFARPNTATSIEFELPDVVARNAMNSLDPGTVYVRLAHGKLSPGVPIGNSSICWAKPSALLTKTAALISPQGLQLLRDIATRTSL